MAASLTSGLVCLLHYQMSVVDGKGGAGIMLTYPDIPEINKLISPKINQYLESVGLSYYAEHKIMQDVLLKDGTFDE